MNTRTTIMRHGIVCMLTALSVSFAGNVGAQPLIAMRGGDTIRMGYVAPTTHKHSAVLVNEGDDTLRITEVKASCGCTSAPLDRNVLAPGDSSTIVFTIDVSNRTGAVAKPVWIASNDPKRPLIGVWLTMNVLRDLASASEFFPMIDSARVGARYETTLAIANAGDAAITVQPPIGERSEALAVSYDLISPARLDVGDTLILTASVQPLQPGCHRSQTRIRCSGRNTPELLLALYCTALQTGAER